MYVIKVGEGFYWYLPPDRGEIMGNYGVTPRFQKSHIFEDRKKAKEVMDSLIGSNEYGFRDKENKIEIKRIVLRQG